MKDEKDINKEGSKSWVETLKEDLSKLNTDFPLSGGEEPATKVTSDTDEELPEVEPAKAHDVDTEFPLSGGEQ